ncbi:hypothetical protein AVEN_201320-1 [Araneus ventricosus]|uniref:DDE-1 domain-containing protein n=1 Tax=Araneus ventricosus TaxID=182803 RepID=A0A4Y2KH00_ARAVE|nr:hypothetical protein AVEN_201320-1 [Araneus ventricosus]
MCTKMVCPMPSSKPFYEWIDVAAKSRGFCKRTGLGTVNLKQAMAGWNADETGLFFQCLPNKTAVFEGEECHGGKQSKLRVTVLLATNQSGKEKLPPAMIGLSKKPRCFAKIKSFPMMHKSNQKAGNFLVIG